MFDQGSLAKDTSRDVITQLSICAFRAPATRLLESVRSLRARSVCAVSRSSNDWMGTAARQVCRVGGRRLLDWYSEGPSAVLRYPEIRR